MDDWMARTPDWMEGMTDLQRDTVARLESREKSCQMRFESLRLDEIDWKVERKKLLAERDGLKQRVAELEAALKPSDRDLRERLVCAIWPEIMRQWREYKDAIDPRGDARSDALVEADKMLAAMWKGEA